jgi:hypothetical protein
MITIIMKKVAGGGGTAIQLPDIDFTLRGLVAIDMIGPISPTSLWMPLIPSRKLQDSISPAV